MPDQEEQQQQQQQQEEKKPQFITMEELDTRLKARDQALLEGLREIMTPRQQEQQQQERREEKREQQVEITGDEFFSNPGKAMEKFFESKIKPAIDARGNQEPPVDLDARVRLNLISQRDAVLSKQGGAEEWKRMEPHLMKVLAKTDPRVLAQPGGMDATYRLTKSHVDDMERAEDEKSGKNQEMKSKANLEQGGKPPDTGSRGVDLDDDEKAMATRMGLSEAEYKQYGNLDEIEIGSKQGVKK